MSSEATRDIHVQAALDRSSGRPETPASNRFRLALLRVGARPKNGNHRGTNGQGVRRVAKSIK